LFSYRVFQVNEPQIDLSPNLTFHGIWKTSLLFLSSFKERDFEFPPTLVGKGAGGLGFALAKKIE
jgi:hypothetical protein